MYHFSVSSAKCQSPGCTHNSGSTNPDALRSTCECNWGRSALLYSKFIHFTDTFLRTKMFYTEPFCFGHDFSEKHEKAPPSVRCIFKQSCWANDECKGLEIPTHCSTIIPGVLTEPSFNSPQTSLHERPSLPCFENAQVVKNEPAQYIKYPKRWTVLCLQWHQKQLIYAFNQGKRPYYFAAR